MAIHLTQRLQRKKVNILTVHSSFCLPVFFGLWVPHALPNSALHWKHKCNAFYQFAGKSVDMQQEQLHLDRKHWQNMVHCLLGSTLQHDSTCTWSLGKAAASSQHCLFFPLIFCIFPFSSSLDLFPHPAPWFCSTVFTSSISLILCPFHYSPLQPRASFSWTPLRAPSKTATACVSVILFLSLFLFCSPENGWLPFAPWAKWGRYRGSAREGGKEWAEEDAASSSFTNTGNAVNTKHSQATSHLSVRKPGNYL